MTHFPQPNPQRRAPRIHLGGSVLALVMLDDGQRAKGKLQTISITGGLLRLVPATRDGYLQPFRFVALEDEHHRALSMTVEAVSDKSFQGIRSSQWSLPKSI